MAVFPLYSAQQFFNIPLSHSGVFMSRPSPSGFSGDSRLVSVVDLPPHVPDPLPAKQMQGPWKLILILNRPAPTKLLPLLTIQHLLVAPVVDHQQSTGS